MAATVLNSPEAIQMSVFVVRAFIKMREALISRSELERRLLRIENVLLAHDESIRELYDQIRPLLLPPPAPPRKRIGFEAKEAAAPYGVSSQLISPIQSRDKFPVKKVGLACIWGPTFGRRILSFVFPVFIPWIITCATVGEAISG